MFTQGTSLAARETIAFKIDGKGKIIILKPAHALWVANSKANQEETQTVEVCRRNRPMGTGYRFPIDSITLLFDVKA